MEPGPVLQSLERLTFETAYPEGAVLFVEGQRPQGIIVICRGRVKLSATSSEGRTLIVRIAEAGEVLGLSATMLGQPYEVTAQTVEPCQVKLIRRDPFLVWLRHNPGGALRVAEELAEEYNSTCQQLRSMLLSHTATQRLARLLLEMATREGSMERTPHVHLGLTHQEMAEMIGSSRETVTRLLALFRQKEMIEIKASRLTIRNREALRGVGQGEGPRLGL